MIAFTTRYVLPVLLSALTAVASGFVGASVGPPKVYWSLVSIAAVIGAAVITVQRTWRTDRAETKAQNEKLSAQEAEAKIAKSLTFAGYPLIASLGELSAAQGQDYLAKHEALLARIVDVAKVQCAWKAENKQDVQAAYYEFGQDEDRLERRHYGGRDSSPPKQVLTPENDNHDNALLRVAREESSILVPSIVDRPDGFSPTRCSALIAVPVRAGDNKLGLLTVDSKESNAFTPVEEGYARLLAGILGAGMIQRDRQASSSGGNLPGPRSNGEQSTTEPQKTTGSGQSSEVEK